MPDKDSALTPLEASCIASNVYFTLKDWAKKAPVVGVEETKIIKQRVIGVVSHGIPNPKDSSMSQTGDMKSAKLKTVLTGRTGWGDGVTSGFGYVMHWEGKGQSHAIIATRGTRPESTMGMAGGPDMMTNLQAFSQPFGSYGPVHGGFKKTFESLQTKLFEKNEKLIRNADVVHCVGHSLGGAVATLVAGHIAGMRKGVKLYTFGAPRIARFDAYQNFEKAIGKNNIYRTCHDLDLIGLIPPYPYMHCNPAPADTNNYTLPSPFGAVNIANHDIAQYIKKARGAGSWDSLRASKSQVEFDNAILARAMMSEKPSKEGGAEPSAPGWVTRASAKTLSLLLKLFRHYLISQGSTTAVYAQTGLDLLSELIWRGCSKIKSLGSKLVSLLKYAAYWAGIKIKNTADFTADIIRAMLNKMLVGIRFIVRQSLQFITRNITPITITAMTSFTMMGCNAF